MSPEALASQKQDEEVAATKATRRKRIIGAVGTTGLLVVSILVFVAVRHRSALDATTNSQAALDTLLHPSSTKLEGASKATLETILHPEETDELAVDLYKCTGWPTDIGSDREKCENGNFLDDGYKYKFDSQRGKKNAVCGECWCCRKSTVRRFLEDGNHHGSAVDRDVMT